MKSLFVFDFDYTLIDENSDTFVMSLCPELELKRGLASKRTEFSSWTKLMDHTLSLLHKQGCVREHIEQHMKQVKLYEQAIKALGAVHSCHDADCIIVSDSNTVFIDLILEGCGIKDLFKTIVTNPARFDEAERLHVEEYHSHGCETCKSTPNLCKGRVVEEYRQQQQRQQEQQQQQQEPQQQQQGQQQQQQQQQQQWKDYDRVVYVGDGRNDYCPCSRLTEKDVVVCREGYGLAKLLEQPTSSCRATVHTIDFVASLGDLITAIV